MISHPSDFDVSIIKVNFDTNRVFNADFFVILEKIAEFRKAIQLSKIPQQDAIYKLCRIFLNYLYIVLEFRRIIKAFRISFSFFIIC